MRIVDSHHHLADLARSYPWLERTGPFPYHGDDTPIRRTYLLDNYLADIGALDLVASVHVENGAADTRAETEWIDRVVAEHGLPTVQVAKVDLLSADAAAELDFQAGFASVRGIRDILNWHPDPRYTHRASPAVMSDPLWRTNFALLAPLGLSFDLQVFPAQLPEAAELAREFADTRIILDHAGMPIGRDPESVAQWRAGMRAMAGCPNVVVKVSALGVNDHRWTVDSIRPFVLDTLDIFGSDRCMWGSNFPVDSLYSTYTRLIEAYHLITSQLTPSERTAFFELTAATAYRLAKLPEPAHRSFLQR
jgi:predicted TIM-barrel fold metal-dependent hydrolase